MSRLKNHLQRQTDGSAHDTSQLGLPRSHAECHPGVMQHAPMRAKKRKLGEKRRKIRLVRFCPNLLTLFDLSRLRQVLMK